MPVRSREAKVFAALAIAMGAGIIILKALGNNPPSAGAFCLSRYTRGVSAEEAISIQAGQMPRRWEQIRIHYSGTKEGNIQQLAFLNRLAGGKDINCHFVICNGLGGDDGQIQPSEKWRRQWLVNSEYPDEGLQSSGKEQCIYICVIADGEKTGPTELQREVTEALVQGLCHKFNIPSESIQYPSNW